MTVALANNPGGATLGGTLTATALDGVATFSGLSLTRPPPATRSGLCQRPRRGRHRAPSTVTPAAASQLVITTEPPASVTVERGFGLQASIEDAYGNVVTTANDTVSVALRQQPDGGDARRHALGDGQQRRGHLLGLTINKAGTGYTLKVSSSGLSSAVSSAISVTKKGGAAIASSTPTASPSDLLLGALVPDSDSPGPKSTSSI